MSRFAARVSTGPRLSSAISSFGSLATSGRRRGVSHTGHAMRNGVDSIALRQPLIGPGLRTARPWAVGVVADPGGTARARQRFPSDLDAGQAPEGSAGRQQPFSWAAKVCNESS